MAFRPEFLDIILHEWDTLNGFPSEEGIVSNEWRTITITDWEPDKQVNEVREVGDWGSVS
jgi:hypothetical protein